MQKRSIALIVALIVALLSAQLPTPAWAQEEGDGYKETFDDPTLPEWEHSREASVADGVLRMSGGSFALRAGDWSDITLTVKMRTSGEGEAVVSYYFRDGLRYTLVLAENYIFLERERDQSLTPLGDSEGAGIRPNTWVNLKVVVSGGQHQVYVDDELRLRATDPDPLETGALLLQAMGEVTVEFDDLELRGTPGEPMPGQGEPVPEGELGEEPRPGAELPPLDGESPPPLTGETTGTRTDGWGGIIEEFFASQASSSELSNLLINLVLSVICACVLSLAYIHWGASLTNRRKFAANFMLMTVTTTFIILVVRSSVALSLGLVGALSIVRFRTAVKEAEELAYLFFAIGIGIGLGDSQRLITLLVLALGIVIIGLMKLLRRSQADVNLHLIVASHSPDKIELEQIMAALHPHTSKLRLLRLDENRETLETSFLAEFRRISSLNDAKGALQALSNSVEITFLDNKGIW